MSNYTTEELICALLGPTLCNLEVDAIIAKLRAGDALYEAAKDEVIRTHSYYLRKAIADYEGKL